MNTRRILGQFLYGTLFLVGIPGLLVWWAEATEAVVPLPALQSTWAGLALTAAGVMLIVAGMGLLVLAKSTRPSGRKHRKSPPPFKMLGVIE